MGKTNIVLRPIHYASVSGGKDSLYMLNLILNNPQKYPLDMVVHYELEIDWYWVKGVIDFMETRCNAAGIKFLRIKPRRSFHELNEKWGYPTRMGRWCNSRYKLDCKRQINDWIKSQNCRPIAYIGLCADEQKRFKYEIGEWKNQDVCYPLAEENINESIILEWAKTVSIFNGWYKIFKRQGCMFCPMLSMLEMAYMYKYYPDCYKWHMEQIKALETRNRNDRGKNFQYFKSSLEVIDYRVKTKYQKILEEKEAFQQMTVDEWLFREGEY